jgi:hypothetical protein
MNLSRNFTLQELIKSDTAIRKGIDNNPNADQVEMILEFYTPGEPNSGWVHCSYVSDSPRKQLLRAYREDGRVKYKPVIGNAKDVL